MSKEHRVAVGKLVHLVHHRLLDSLVIVPDARDRGATGRVKDCMAVGEGKVSSVGGRDLPRRSFEGSVKDCAWGFRVLDDARLGAILGRWRSGCGSHLPSPLGNMKSQREL